MGKEGNAGIKIKHISLLKNKLVKKCIIFLYKLDKNKQKSMQIFLILKINLVIFFF